MHVAVLQGPNLNRLGVRRPEKYGRHTLADITADLDEVSARLGVTLDHVQSNHEGALLDWLHERQDALTAIIANPAGLSPYGKSLRDAFVDTGLPVAIVHIAQLHRYGDIDSRDIFRDIATVYVAGLGWRGYRAALERLHEIHVEST